MSPEEKKAFEAGMRGERYPFCWGLGDPDVRRANNSGLNERAKWSFLEPKPKRKSTVPVFHSNEHPLVGAPSLRFSDSGGTLKKKSIFSAILIAIIFAAVGASTAYGPLALGIVGAIVGLILPSFLVALFKLTRCWANSRSRLQ